MELKQVALRHLKMKMKTPFRTSLGVEYEQDFILVEVVSADGISGWAESVAEWAPYYKEETVKTNWSMLKDHLIPLVSKSFLTHPDEIFKLFTPIRRNYMAKASIEQAIWDLYAKKEKMPLAKVLGGTKEKIEVGVSIGIKSTVEELLEEIQVKLDQGYKRIKIKIEPSWDVDVVSKVRKRFPDIPLMVDANSAYTLADVNHLKKLDAYNLLMIEQPLAHDDIIDHAQLQKQLNTSICLDESICSYEDAYKAIKLGSCKIINIKLGRVGGLLQAKRIHDLCQQNNIPVWCGGMCEAGIGRAHNIAISTLANFAFPGDTAASSHYWKQDIIVPEVHVQNGEIVIPNKPGIGYDIDLEQINFNTLYSEIIHF